MKKKSTILVILILLLAIVIGFLIYLTIYKSKVFNEDKEEFSKNSISSQKYEFDSLNYNEIYSNYIIDEMGYNALNIKLEDSGNISNVIIKVNDNNELYIKDADSDKEIKLKDDIVGVGHNYQVDSWLYFYAFDVNKKVYLVSLTSLDINDIVINECITSIKTNKVTSLYVFMLYGNNVKGVSNDVVVIDEDGKFYEIRYGNLYNENDMYIDNKYIVHGDKSISNIKNYLLKDSNNNNYIIDKYIRINEEYTLEGANTSDLIITNDNKLLILKDDYIYEYNKKIESIEESNNIVTITCENKKTFTFKGEITDINKTNEIFESYKDNNQ